MYVSVNCVTIGSGNRLFSILFCRHLDTFNWIFVRTWYISFQENAFQINVCKVSAALLLHFHVLMHLYRWMSAISFMGDPVEVYRYGAIYFMLTLGYTCGAVIAAPYATRIHRLQIVSIYEVSWQLTCWIYRKKQEINLAVGIFLGHVYVASTSTLSKWKTGAQLSNIFDNIVADGMATHGTRCQPPWYFHNSPELDIDSLPSELCRNQFGF